LRPGCQNCRFARQNQLKGIACFPVNCRTFHDLFNDEKWGNILLAYSEGRNEGPLELAEGSSPALFSIENLTVRYPGSRPEDPGVTAVDNISFQARRGEFISVVGPSGCGKSTLLSAMAGLLTGYQGKISIHGEEVKGPHRDIGVVFQEESTFPWRSVQRNVEFGLEMRGVPKAERQAKATEVIAMVGLSDFADRHPGQLSGGMKQRVAIARTLVTEPDILLMDEPFGALDEQTRIMLGDELLRIQRLLNQTAILITHNIQEAVLLSDRVIVVSARPGRVKAVIDIDLPKKRNSTLLATEHFGELVGQIWSVLREESLNAFAQQNHTKLESTSA
jgi:NitT/TauT family transport system ATP-binding protein